MSSWCRKERVSLCPPQDGSTAGAAQGQSPLHRQGLPSYEPLYTCMGYFFSEFVLTSEPCPVHGGRFGVWAPKPMERLAGSQEGQVRISQGFSRPVASSPACGQETRGLGSAGQPVPQGEQ